MPINLDEEGALEAAGRVDVLFNKVQDLIATYYTEEGQVKVKKL